MTKAPISLQDLRRRIYIKAKAEPSWRFWGLYVHVCKLQVLQEAYQMAKANEGAPGMDGVTFEQVERTGVAQFISQLRDELLSGSYTPGRVRRVGIPKGGGGTRVLSIPSIRDRVVQGALKLILEPIFEADFQSGSFGYRPRKSAQGAVQRVKEAMVWQKTRVIDLDLKAYFDNVRHDMLLRKVAARVNDAQVMALLRAMLKSSGHRGVPQGGVISPLLSNIYLNEVDRMLERAREVTRNKWGPVLEYARFADDLVVLVDWHPRHDRLFANVITRLRQELHRLDVEIVENKSRVVNLAKGESFGFLGFDFRQVRRQSGPPFPLVVPLTKKRTELLRKLKSIFNSPNSHPVRDVIKRITPILRGWVNYFAIGNSSDCFGYIRMWVDKKVRRHLAKARKRRGFGWKRWSRTWLANTLGLFQDYRVKWLPHLKAAPAR